ncbi:MAG: hypothetical protein PWP31_1646 [Clostridia bacterium]|nr:hypothetical protein [Clostridia bacterium]
MQLTFEYKIKTIQFEVIYRKRKTMVIRVTPPGKVTVISPIGIPKELILEKVKNKAPWILKKISELKNEKYLQVKKKYENDEDFLYLGTNYPLQIEINPKIKKTSVDLYCGKFIIKAPENNVEKFKKAIEVWYRKKALEKINERVEYYSTIIKRNPNKISIRNQKTIWGSCRGNNLNFNWRIIMAPLRVLNYLVVHEMSHMVHPNHSKDFWNLVSSIIPEYKSCKDWLKENSNKLFYI